MDPAAASAPKTMAATIISRATPSAAAPNANQTPQPAVGTAPLGNGTGLETAKPVVVDEGQNFAERFASLTRQEQRLLEERKEFAKDKSEIMTLRELKQKALDDPLAVMAHYGISYKDLTEKVLGSETKPLTTEEQLQALRDEIAADKKKQLDKDEEKAQENEQAFIKGETEKWQEGIASHVSESGDQYEVIKAYGQSALELVWEVTEHYFEVNEKMLSIPDACRMVEEHLEEEAKKLIGLKRFTGSQPKTQNNVPPLGTSQPQQRSTQTSSITNQQTLSTAQAPKSGAWDDQATRQQAIDLINQSFQKRRDAVN